MTGCFSGLLGRQRGHHFLRVQPEGLSAQVRVAALPDGDRRQRHGLVESKNCREGFGRVLRIRDRHSGQFVRPPFGFQIGATHILKERLSLDHIAHLLI